jgi:hypothetical protein
VDAVHVNRIKWRNIYVQSPDHCEARRLHEHANDRRIRAGQKFTSQQRSQSSWAQAPSNWKTRNGKIGNNTVTAEVSNDKVVGMSAGSLPARKVKSNKKQANGDADILKIAANGPIQLAQVDVYYYGYCFDSGIDEYCYWYPASDVIVTDPWAPY